MRNLSGFGRKQRTYNRYQIISIMSSEIWKPIKDYEGLYEVSSLGRIKSMPKKFIRNGAVTHFEEKILTPSDSHGYRSVVLTKNGIHKTHSVHRLVALAFIQNPNKS